MSEFESFCWYLNKSIFSEALAWVCPSSHPFVIDKGQQCCGKRYQGQGTACSPGKSVSVGTKLECCTDALPCPRDLCKGFGGMETFKDTCLVLMKGLTLTIQRVLGKIIKKKLK